LNFMFGHKITELKLSGI